jgi:hypothetical protein
LGVLGRDYVAGKLSHQTNHPLLMNRRNFLQRSSFAVAAAAGLPLALKKAGNASPHLYKGTAAGKKTSIQYGLVINHIAVNSFSQSTGTERIMTLGIKEYRNSNQDMVATGEFNCTTERSLAKNGENDTWTIHTSVLERISGTYELPKRFPRSLTLVVHPFEFADLLNAKGKSIVKLNYDSAVESGSGSSGCFLTTACVQHKQLADDCDELQTLRMLRDNYMSKTEEGQSMIRQYITIAPGIVHAIDQYENKSEIYEYMYRHMITPAVQLVKRGQWREATDHYMIFVKALKEKYC